MKIAVSSQNRKTITGHAGKASRFYLYRTDRDTGEIAGRELLELAREDILHIRFHESADPWAPHPLFEVDVIITGGAGPGFVNRLASRGVEVIITPEADPDTAVRLYLAGRLPALPPAHHR